MKIVEITKNKRALMPLLIIGDEEETMVEKYINTCTLFAAYEGSECVAVCAAEEYAGESPLGRALEIKNIAVLPAFRKRGAGRALIEFIADKFGGEYAAVIAGTGESPLTVPFYEKCGFKRCGKIKDYFLKNYSHPIYECGVQLSDLVYFIRPLGAEGGKL